MKWKAFNQASWSSLASYLKALVKKADDNASALSSLGEDVATLSTLTDAEFKKIQAQLGGYIAQAEPPGNTGLLWIDTGSGNIMKFYDPKAEAWKPVGAVWS